MTLRAPISFGGFKHRTPHAFLVERRDSKRVEKARCPSTCCPSLFVFTAWFLQRIKEPKGPSEGVLTGNSLHCPQGEGRSFQMADWPVHRKTPAGALASAKNIGADSCENARELQMFAARSSRGRGQPYCSARSLTQGEADGTEQAFRKINQNK